MIQLTYEGEPVTKEEAIALALMKIWEQLERIADMMEKQND